MCIRDRIKWIWLKIHLILPDMTFNKIFKYLISLLFLSILFHTIIHKNNLVFSKTMHKKVAFFSFSIFFVWIRHLKRYNSMLEKATFFVLQTSYTNELKGLYIAGNSYPYYQDKKKLVFNSFQKPFKNHQSTKIPRE